MPISINIENTFTFKYQIKTKINLLVFFNVLMNGKTIDHYIDQYINKEIDLGALCILLELPKTDVYDLLEEKGVPVFNEINKNE